jgi:hypothetical protein
VLLSHWWANWQCGLIIVQPATVLLDRLRQAMAAGRKGRQKPQDGLRET